MLSLYKKEDSILLIGPYPKPLGGISVHSKRLFYLLKKEGFNIVFYNLNKKSIPGIQWVGLLFHLIFKRYDVIHIQLFEPFFYKRILWLCKLKNTHLILTIHNPIVTTRIRKHSELLNRTGTIVMVGDHIYKEYDKQGIQISTNLKIISSYIPPNEEEEKGIIATYPKELINFINTYDKLLLVSAYKLILTDDGTDLYGIDKSIALLKELSGDYKSIGLIIAIGNEKFNNEYYNKIKDIVEAVGLNKQVFFLVNQKEIWPLFKKINLFLRPTCYDGFGISVAEAINMGCKAIASNVCVRAEGAIIYDYNNPNELVTKAKKVLFNR